MEPLKHECGVALIRLLKPQEHYRARYRTSAWAMEKLYLMMEKQHNRGQEGAGIACVDMDAPDGTEYMFRERAEGKDAITEVFRQAGDGFRGQLYMGHLRYSTTGRSGLTFVHPFLRRNNWRARNLCLCGNFNMTNIDEVFGKMVAEGQSPRINSDSYITLERMGHRLDREFEHKYADARRQGLQGRDATRYIEEHIDLTGVLRTSLEDYDGGYVLCGLTGSGEMFAIRDPWGIRTAFWYRDGEVVALASERAVLQTTFDLDASQVTELLPGQALLVHRDGRSELRDILPQRGYSPCSFERIYVSRGSDQDIYRERKRLGRQLTEPVLQAVGGDTDHMVLSFIPNTAEVAFFGLAEGFRERGIAVRSEKVAWKDIKLRTFITDAGQRNDLAAHVYDITYGSLRPREDTLVIIDDSIVRGTTLHESILKILDRLHPRKIVMVSSSPQIRYPDYYGIDMARLEEFCAFRAAMALLRERGMQPLIDQTYEACREELRKPAEAQRNCVRDLYAPFSAAEISRKIAEMLRPEGMETPVELIFQSIEGLHEAIPGHGGDWYFTGRYPTPGGIRLVNRAFLNYMESQPDFRGQ